MTVLSMVLAAYRRWKTYRDTYDELATLDDRTLADLNINRDDIESVARRAASQAA